MKKFKKWVDKVVTSLLGIIWTLTILALTGVAFVWSVKLLLRLMGV